MKSKLSTLTLGAAAGGWLLLSSILFADTIILNNGNRLEGKILREDETYVHMAVGGQEMRLPRNQIREIDRGVAEAYFEDRVKRAVELSGAAVGRGDYGQATRPLEEISLEIRQTMRDLPDADEQAVFLRGLLDRLEEARRKTVPPDPANIEAEQLFTAAMADIDFVKYGDAFEKLRRAGTLAPQRGDIQLELATTAERVGRTAEAVRAYRTLIQLDAETYYPRIGAGYLDLLRSEGTKLINQRRADDALIYFEDLVLIEQVSDGKPIPVEEFLARRAAREAMSEEEVLMEVYRYADGNDLVDLAFAAVVKIEKSGSDNPEIKRLVAESRFLSELKRAIDGGDVAAAANVLANNPDLANSERLADRVKRLSGEEARALEAQRILNEGMAAFNARDYRTAMERARTLLVDYTDEEASAEAAKLLSDSEFEEEIREEVDAIQALLDDAKDDEAQVAVDALLEDSATERSVQLPLIRALAARIPMEKRADELWMLAKADLDSDRHEQALERLDELAGSYGETRSGKRAAEWLQKNRNRLLTETTRYRPKEVDYISAWTDLSLWRAAADPAMPRTALQVPPVEDTRRRDARDAFRKVVEVDNAARPEGRPFGLWFGIPAGVAALILGGMILRFAPRGKARFSASHGTEEIHDFPEGYCRGCGYELPEEAVSCTVCGLGLSLTEDEALREQDAKRRSDFDPWDQRVKGDDLNQFDKYYQQAKELSESSDAQAAIDACREALREDPRRVEGYTLLAELYERTNQKEQAAICYREILLIDPANAMVRQKLDASSKPTGLDPGPIPAFLAIACWWLVCFTAIGVDMEAVWLRVPLCILGAVLSFQFLKIRQRHRSVFVPAKQRTDIDVHRNLTKDCLKWREQNRQAKLLAEVIEEHTGVAVPRLSTWRLFVAAALSLLLLAGMALFVWQGGSWLMLLGWPAGAALIIYLIEVHPRLYVANVVLRHLMEEVLAPWADPHRPFHPKGMKPEPIGEFLITRPEELPIRWALKPIPYPTNRQGVLDSLMQVLNRHWAFHRYYGAAQIKRDSNMPVPAGTNFAWLILVLCLAAVAGSAWRLWFEQSSRIQTYEESMTIGYEHLLDGRVMDSVDYFSQAARLDPTRVAPHLYMGHAFAAAGMDIGARRSFHLASLRAHHLPQAHNDFANFLQRQGELRAALDQYRIALQQERDNADILNNCGSAHYKLQEYREAEEFLRRAIAADPEHTRAYTTLGLVLEEMGDREGATEAYETAVRVAPDLPYTQVARDRLAAGVGELDRTPLRLESPLAQGKVENRS